MKLLFSVMALFFVFESSRASGLKKVNYQDQTAETQTSSVQGAEAPSGLSPEEAKKLLQDIDKIKANQLESQKILDELEKEP